MYLAPLIREPLLRENKHRKVGQIDSIRSSEIRASLKHERQSLGNGKLEGETISWISI